MGEQGKQLSVLIVEDDSIARKALVWLLSDLGFRVTSAATLAEARAALKANRPEVVILDLILPDGDGTSLLAEIRRAKLPIKVAIVTGVSEQLRLHQVTALNPDALFGKPLDLEDFDGWILKQLAHFSLTTRDELLDASHASPAHPMELTAVA